MGFEKVVATRPERQPAQPCNCPLPDASSYGPGTVWVCSTCRTRWVMTPSKTLRYGLGAWVEVAAIVIPVIMAAANEEPFGWRRTKVMDGWAITFLTLMALIMVPKLLTS